MSLIDKVIKTKELFLAVGQDVLSMGGFWIVDGQTKTGRLLDDWRYQEQLADHITGVIKSMTEEPKK